MPLNDDYRTPPPPVIDSARVVAYAFVEDLAFSRWGSLYVGEKLLEHVPRLAICLNLGTDLGAILLHCDLEWNSLGTSLAPTVSDTKARAERNYPGVALRWIDTGTSVEEALEYYDAEVSSGKCSFCAKRPFEMDGWVEGDSAIICRSCIGIFHRERQTDL